MRMSHSRSRGSSQGWIWTSHSRSGVREASNSRLGGKHPSTYWGQRAASRGQDTAGPEEIPQQDGGTPQQVRAHPTVVAHSHCSQHGPVPPLPLLTGWQQTHIQCCPCSLCEQKPPVAPSPASAGTWQNCAHGSVRKCRLCSSCLGQSSPKCTPQSE